MKKLAVFLALVFVVLCLTGCGISQNNTKGIWSIQKTTDEFGDVTADSQDVINASVQGAYANEATTESGLGVSVSFRKRFDFNHYVLELQLTGNDTSKIQYEEDSYKQLKTKVGEETQEFYLTLEKSSGKLSNGDEVFYKIKYGGDYIFSNLYDGKDVKCVITIDDVNLYSFELKSDNFNALCEANSFTKGAGDITVKESINFLLQDKGIMIEESCDCLVKEFESFDVVETEELNEILDCAFLQIFLYRVEDDSDDFRRWKLAEYDSKEGIIEGKGFYILSEEDEYKFGRYREDFHGYNLYREFLGWKSNTRIEINDGKVNSYDNLYEIRKISDNILILRRQYNDGGGVEPDYGEYSVLIKGEDFASKYTLKQGIRYAQDNYIQEIPY